MPMSKKVGKLKRKLMTTQELLKELLTVSEEFQQALHRDAIGNLNGTSIYRYAKFRDIVKGTRQAVEVLKSM